jgi:4-hydroxy-tetrahydrodipicolinate synthase
VTCKFNAAVYANRTSAAGEEAQLVLSAMRKIITSVPLIPGLKSLLARQYKDPEWVTIRPPHQKLSPAAEAQLFSNFDSCASEHVTP